ncbi:MAG: pyruvate kinase [Candidatus Neomarinimicrobiota bacterium]
MNNYNNTKIIATIGPSCDKKNILDEMVTSGVDIFRLNMSHGDEPSKRHLYSLIKSLKFDDGSRPTILTDLSGPKIRVTGVKNNYKLSEGQFVLITNKKNYGESDIQVTNGIEFNNIRKGAKILIDDGKVQLEATQIISKNSIECKTLIGGEVNERKGVNFPGISIDTPSLTEQDISDLKIALEAGADWIALSFVRSEKDILAVHKIMDENGKRLPIMAKIEKWEALEKLDSIANVFDGIMVARGDLGVEIPAEQVPLAQKRIINLAGLLGKPVVIATQLLESMLDSKTPTRAEVSDIANAVYDSADALMVTGETAIGKNPVDVIKTLKLVIIETERSVDSNRPPLLEDINKTPDAISHAVSQIARDLNINLIMTMTHSGSTARMISRYRPKAKVFALTPFDIVMRQLRLVWGVIPIKVDNYDNIDEIPELCINVLNELGEIKKGDKFVITGGVPMGVEGTTNYLSVLTN